MIDATHVTEREGARGERPGSPQSTDFAGVM